MLVLVLQNTMCWATVRYSIAYCSTVLVHCRGDTWERTRQDEVLVSLFDVGLHLLSGCRRRPSAGDRGCFGVASLRIMESCSSSPAHFVLHNRTSTRTRTCTPLLGYVFCSAVSESTATNAFVSPIIVTQPRTKDEKCPAIL